MTTVTINARATGQRRRGRAANRAVWVLQVLTSALFVFASVPKLTADPMAVAGFDVMGLGTAGMYVVGGLELLGAVALLVPVLCGLAAAAQVALMVGAVVLSLVFVGGGAALALPVGTLVVVSVIAWARRRRTVELVGLVRRYARR
ncbi:DoxX family protein [Pseudonocardia acaciae]|uniref:DoxX family protein n=1 Tax=Pseudonocardia acaciae TaxID=551276 RepID=UPI0007E8CA2D|nr:DoxX family protein [Pseudonocardia acaciae]